MKKLIVLISVIMMSSTLFADPDWDFAGSAGLKLNVEIKQPPTPEGGDKPDAATTMTWAEDGLDCKVTVTTGDVTGSVKLRKEGDVSAALKVSDAFTLKIGKFGRQGYKVGGSKGPYHLQKANFAPGGGGQIELLFTADPSKFYISLYDMKQSADRGIAAISTCSKTGKTLAFADAEGEFKYDAFIPEIALTYAFANDVFSASAGGALHTFKLKPSPYELTTIVNTDTTKETIKRDTVQITSFGAGLKLGITAGIFSMGVAGCYVVNPGVIGGVGDRGFSKLSYKVGEVKGDLIGNSFIGFAADIDLKLGEVGSAEVGMGYGFNSMDIEGFENDAHVAAHLQFNFTALEAIAITPEVGFDLDVANYNGDKGDMTYYFLVANKISF